MTLATDYAKVRLTALGTNPTYIRRWNAVSYDDYDANGDDLTGNGQLLWGATSNIMYFGSASKFFRLGWRVGSVTPNVSGVTWEYSSGASGWTTLTPFYDNIGQFTADGFMAWADPSGTLWASHTHSGALPAAYWIRAQIAGFTAPSGRMLSALQSMVLRPPVKLDHSLPDGFVRDVNSDLQKADLAYDGPNKLQLDCQLKATIDSNGKGMPQMNLLQRWQRDRVEFFIEDLAQNTTPDLTADSFYKDYTGRLSQLNGIVKAVGKMKAGQGYTLNFEIEDATAVMQ